MVRDYRNTRIFKVFRYEPTNNGDEGHYDVFEIEIEKENTTTILDVLLKIKRKQDISLAFRFACRIGMCGSCGMVINGREALACRTVIADLKGKEITIRPLNHFPIVKDLIVDMDPFFQQYQKAMPYFEAKEQRNEPAIIPPDCNERKLIGLHTECIACGCCVSSCTMANNHQDYMGPAAINRAFTLLVDSRDGLHEQRMDRVLDSCYHCRSELNCTEVCPKEISPTKAIKFIQRMALTEAFRSSAQLKGTKDAIHSAENHLEAQKEYTRRKFLSSAILGLGAGSTVFLGGMLSSSILVSSFWNRSKKWVRVGRLEDIPPGSIKNIQISYQVKDGFYENLLTKPILVSRGKNQDEITVFSSRCTHLGCTVHWDEGKTLFLCACHGGVYFPDGRVKAGPPPRPLERYLTKVDDGQLFVMET